MLKTTTPMFGKREDRVPHPILMNAVATAARAHASQEHKAASSHASQLIVGADVRLRSAEIEACDTLVVEGRVEANMNSRLLRIAEKGEFCGKVEIDIAEIHGRFNGELHVRDQLIIHPTGQVSGKIRYGRLLIKEGGQLCGDIQRLDAESADLSSGGTD